MSLARQLARLVRGLAAKPLPLDVERKTRIHVADCMGVALGGMQSPELRRALAAARAGGTRGDCAVWRGTTRLPPSAAAFVNAAAAHVLDFEDVHDAARLHVTSVTLPAALAATQVQPAMASRLLHAVAIGNDAMCRMGLALHATGESRAADWLLTQVLGYFGAAVAAGTVLALDEQQMTSALGFAYMQAAGGKETAFGTGSNARSLYPGFASSGGVQAALLAAAGLTTPATTLDGKASLLAIYFDRADASPASMLDHVWPWRDTDAKRWPCCRLSHPYVQSALELAPEVDGAAVDAVELHVNASAATLCRPFDQRIAPTTLADAKYSLPFVVAFALARGRIDVAELTDAALADPTVLALAAKVEVIESQADRAGLPVGSVAVRARGQQWRRDAELTAMQEGDIRRKFTRCLETAGVRTDAARLWDRLLEDPADLLSRSIVVDDTDDIEERISQRRSEA